LRWQGCELIEGESSCRQDLNDRPSLQNKVGAAKPGIRANISNRSLLVTGIMKYLRNGGKLEVAQQMANHGSTHYDRAV